ncbi:MAG TPA: hypothetical protein VFQ68_41720 [Streptosporangiaceae bacterium]|nr:hypothetical protein [Streptosporangiaceae bacterium]
MTRQQRARWRPPDWSSGSSRRPRSTAWTWWPGRAGCSACTPFYLHSQHVSTTLTGWIVVRSVLLNLLAFVLWAIFGLGLGTLIRSQVISVVAGLAVYLGGFAAVELIFHGIYYFYPCGWVLGGPVIAPAVASNVMITPGRAFPHAPPQRAGLVIMLGYVMAITAAGVALTRRRDVTS